MLRPRQRAKQVGCKQHAASNQPGTPLNHQRQKHRLSRILKFSDDEIAESRRTSFGACMCGSSPFSRLLFPGRIRR